MTTRAQLQSKSIDELREVAEAAGIDTDGLQKSKLIAALMDAGEAQEGKPTDVDLPKATPRTDKSDTPESKMDDDSDDGDDGNDSQNDNRSGGGGKGRQRNRRRRDDERVPEDQLEVREGILDILPEGYGFLRVTGYKSGDKDVYVSANQVRKFGLAQRGHHRLTPLFPDVRLRLEVEGASNNILTRIVDLIAPIGKGQRGLIVSPPKAGKTTVLKEIAQRSREQPECYLMVVLVDERPEEVTDMQRSVKGEVIYSTFDRPAEDHTQVSELAIERAKRLVERGPTWSSCSTRSPGSPVPTTSRRRQRAGSSPVVSTRPGPLPAEAVLRRGPQHRGGRLADHHRHRAGRDRLEDGRGDLRGVQGHRQHGAAPRPPAGRQADLPGHRHRGFGNTKGGAAVRPDGARPGLEAA
jgi:transcription termination factor Rho